ncbi:hypothetical protein GOV03_01135 [Candidatus Woesearchaeota archaeon]|nr:hypothetical protein [Candidatus Woesearchaeota archaeon]
MSIENYFEVPEGARTIFIDGIVGELPRSVRESSKERAIKIVDKYEGQDINALSILAYAAERGRFDEFAEKLEEHHQKNLCYVLPEARSGTPVLRGAARAAIFFVDCYKSMKIEPYK